MIKEFSEIQIAQMVELIDDNKEIFLSVEAWCELDDNYHEATFTDVYINKPRFIILLKELLGVYDE